MAEIAAQPLRIQRADDIIKLVKKHLVMSVAKMFLFSLVIVPAVVFGSDRSVSEAFIWFLVLNGFYITSAYAGVLIPLRNRHESLVNRYSDVYLDETTKAIQARGIGKLIHTHWFDVYAAEFCKLRLQK